jgi:hypothetical protein
MKLILCLLLAIVAFLPVSRSVNAQAAEDALPLRLTDANLHDAALERGEDGTYTVRTTGPDPYVFTEPFAVSADDARRNRHVLAFEYFSTTGTDHVQVFLDPPVSEARSVKGPGLSNSQGWSRYALDLTPALNGATGNLRALRIDLGSGAGKVVQIRSLQLRSRTKEEAERVARRAAQRASEARREVRLRNYLSRTYPCAVTRVAVDAQHVRVEGEVAGNRARVGLFLAEAPLYLDVTEVTRFPTVTPIRADAAGRFSATLDRYRQKHDRLLSRWAVVRVKATGGGYELLSHARYPDEVSPQGNLPEEKPRNKKGLGGFTLGYPQSDLDDLGISAATVNVVLNGLLSTTPGEERTPFSYGWRTWYANDRQVEQMDRTMLAAAQRHIVVSAIVLIGHAGNSPFGRLLAHPDADPAGIFIMPNVSGEEGMEAYAAALDFLAQRYSRPDGRYGRIHHWILHNEVNAGWVWTNAGEKTPLAYTDLYQRSLRMAHLIARQYDAHAQAFISLEHHWKAPPSDPRIYAGRELLDLLLDFSRAEGDFPWAIAFHPYPQNLFDPRVWRDDQVAFTFDTPKITFKNLEVLDAWVRQPRTFYGDTRGRRVPRTVHLTEQGLNSRDYSEASLRDQAAGMAYAWNKYRDLDSIAVFHYHNWVDNRGEGGLRIGLRRFPDDKDDPLGKKPIWFVYQALGTARENEVTAPYKSVVGVTDWAEVRHATGVPTR